MSQTQKYQVAVVTATRAEFGLLANLIEQLNASPLLECQLYVTGAHLLSSQGNTVNEIKARVPIFAEVPIFETEDTNSDISIALATSQAMRAFSKQFDQHKPDILVVLGDRYELLGICSAALLNHIPIAHIHGGEVTEGAMDEAIRHAVTKLANLHFVAAEAYRKRVIQMGEQPSQVHTVGSPGLDVIENIDYLTATELEENLGFKLKDNIILMTYHPVSWGSMMGKLVLKKVFKALEETAKKQPITLIWTGANADASGQALNQEIQNWIQQTDINAYFVQSLGSQRYLSLMKLAKVVLGNSSSGIIEAPAMQVATVNMGERQKGRLSAESIIHCGETQIEIEEVLEKALSETFQNKLATTESLYGKGQVAQAMTQHLEQFLSQRSIATNLNKPFYDLPECDK